jgi:hypothetical protein
MVEMHLDFPKLAGGGRLWSDKKALGWLVSSWQPGIFGMPTFKISLHGFNSSFLSH